MIHSNKRTFLWLMGGIVFALSVLLVVSGGLAGNVTVVDPEGIPEAANAAMNSIHTGNWKALEEMISGCPALAPETGEPDSAERMIYDAYLNRLQWTCEDTFSIQGAQAAQNITVTCLDIPGVTGSMTLILAESDNLASSQDQIPLLRSAAMQVLETEPPMIRHEITLRFLRRQGRWLLVPDGSLQALLSGFTAH